LAASVLLLCAGLAYSGPSSETKHQYYRDLNLAGVVIDGAGVAHDVRHLTYAGWVWDNGKVKSYQPLSELAGRHGNSEVRIPITLIKNLVIEKEKKEKDKNGNYRTDVWAEVTLWTGSTHRVFIKEVLENGMNNPYCSFIGETDIGSFACELWMTAKVQFLPQDQAVPVADGFLARCPKCETTWPITFAFCPYDGEKTKESTLLVSPTESPRKYRALSTLLDTCLARTGIDPHSKEAEKAREFGTLWLNPVADPNEIHKRLEELRQICVHKEPDTAPGR